MDLRLGEPRPDVPFNKTVRVTKPTSGDATLGRHGGAILGDQAATLRPPTHRSTSRADLDCPDVIVTKTAAKGTIDAGDTASFTIAVTNNGPGIAKE